MQMRDKVKGDLQRPHKYSPDFKKKNAIEVKLNIINDELKGKPLSIFTKLDEPNFPHRKKFQKRSSLHCWISLDQDYTYIRHVKSLHIMIWKVMRLTGLHLLSTRPLSLLSLYFSHLRCYVGDSLSFQRSLETYVSRINNTYFPGSPSRGSDEYLFL